ncbi:MAG: phosphate--nucleotide phosphotransferase, partial [Amnibacterium sp.]|nr:phosphate--nucleotide phosphotransferase [Amnibacterium sp.]
MSGPQPVGADLHLADVDPSSTPGIANRREAVRKRQGHADDIADLQERLYAAGKEGGGRSVLLVLQAMDTAGKGGIVRHVIGAMDPQGVHLHAFKAPTAEERAHDFLWRIRAQLPAPGMIG